MTAARHATQAGFQLRFSSVDPEALAGLPCGKLTNASMTSSGLLTVVLMALIYGTSWAFSGRADGPGPVVWRYLTAFDRIPIFIALLTLWTLAILAVKAWKIHAQRRALEVSFMPRDPMWVLNGETADAVIARLATMVEEPERFMYLRRCLGVLRTMRNIGRVADAEELFESRAGADEAVVDGGYTAVKAFIWGIPVLGFIGTVLGLTEATGNFGRVLADPEMKRDLEALASGLTDVLGGLDTAFVTTAEGLVAAFVLYMAQMLVKQQDERLLDDVREACSTNVVTRVRVSEAREVR
jgi:biopolymer transport protein ExbB/TolQ